MIEQERIFQTAQLKRKKKVYLTPTITCKLILPRITCNIL